VRSLPHLRHAGILRGTAFMEPLLRTKKSSMILCEALFPLIFLKNPGSEKQHPKMAALIARATKQLTYKRFSNKPISLRSFMTALWNILKTVESSRTNRLMRRFVLAHPSPKFQQIRSNGF